jgi:hypothetical protein
MDPLAMIIARKFAEVAAEPAPKPVLWTEVTLDESSHNALVEWWKKHTDAPILAKVHAHHMTIKFKPTAEEIEATPVGKKVHMRVIGWAADEKGQAVLVEPHGVASANPHPHVTVAVAEGSNPKYSNDLLAKGANRVSGPTLSGTVQARP